MLSIGSIISLTAKFKSIILLFLPNNVITIWKSMFNTVT